MTIKKNTFILIYLRPDFFEWKLQYPPPPPPRQTLWIWGRCPLQVEMSGWWLLGAGPFLLLPLSCGTTCSVAASFSVQHEDGSPIYQESVGWSRWWFFLILCHKAWPCRKESGRYCFRYPQTWATFHKLQRLGTTVLLKQALIPILSDTSWKTFFLLNLPGALIKNNQSIIMNLL